MKSIGIRVLEMEFGKKIGAHSVESEKKEASSYRDSTT